MVADDKKRIQITLSVEMLEKLEQIANEIGISKSAMAAVAVTEWMRGRQEPHDKK